jgi:hypothetical protein
VVHETASQREYGDVELQHHPLSVQPNQRWDDRKVGQSRYDHHQTHLLHIVAVLRVLLIEKPFFYGTLHFILIFIYISSPE